MRTNVLNKVAYINHYSHTYRRLIASRNFLRCRTGSSTVGCYSIWLLKSKPNFSLKPFCLKAIKLFNSHYCPHDQIIQYVISWLLGDKWHLFTTINWKCLCTAKWNTTINWKCLCTAKWNHKTYDVSENTSLNYSTLFQQISSTFIAVAKLWQWTETVKWELMHSADAET